MKILRGFTLIEVMVAMGVLTISLVGTLPMLSMGLTKAVHGRKLTVAQYVGSMVLDRLRFEVRTDPGTPANSECGSNSGCTNGDEFSLANAWQSERLPHSPSDYLVAEDGPGCNPGGTDDGVEYGVGPFPLRFEGGEYLVCYRLADASGFAGSPPNSLSARVKVIWPSPIGYGSYTVTGTLVGGGVPGI